MKLKKFSVPFLKSKRLVVLLIILFLMCCTYRQQHYLSLTVIGSSMEPTYHSGEYVRYSTDITNILPGDIIVFRMNGEILIKRVKLVEGNLYTQDILEPEFYSTNYTTLPQYELNKLSLNLLVIPHNYLFVEGDNAIVSYDSNAFGPISKNLVIGKVVQ